MFSPSPEDEEEKSRETESFKGTEESEESERSELLYGVDDSPSCILSLLLGFQVTFVCTFLDLDLERSQQTPNMGYHVEMCIICEQQIRFDDRIHVDIGSTVDC